MTKQVAFLVSLGAVITLIMTGLFGFLLGSSLGQSSAYLSTARPAIKDDKPVVVETLSVSWSAPQKKESLKLFYPATENNTNYTEKIIFAEPASERVAKESYLLISYYSVGSLTYKGVPSTLVMVKAAVVDMGGATARYFFIKNSSGLTFLERVSDKLHDWSGDRDDNEKLVKAGYGREGMLRTAFTIDNASEIKELLLPAKITGPSARQELFLADVVDTTDEYQVARYTNPAERDVFAVPSLGMVRTNTTTNAFVLQTKSPLIGVYRLIPDIYPPVTSPTDPISYTTNITWNDGEKNNGEYLYQRVGGCGYSNYAFVVSTQEVDLKKETVVVGKTAQGDAIYALKNTEHPLLKEIYDYSHIAGEKTDYQAFIKARPLVFWVDPFGRTIGLRSAKFQPQAECGKPVIYLYPTSTIEANVYVQPQGGFTYTDPPYVVGWKVKAQPNGHLTDLRTNKEYPYLYWEGRGGIYEQPKQGWVVKQTQLKTFLPAKLKALGLNKHETADFMDFWLQRMTEKPYYFVTFMGNSTMDTLAPLTVEPKPDTVIRILMDFKPLDKPIAVKGYTIKTPKRKGFTVVEWGGVLR